MSLRSLGTLLILFFALALSACRSAEKTAADTEAAAEKYAFRADNQIKLRDFDKALIELHHGTMFAPKSALLWQQKGRVYILKKDLAKAEENLNKALELDSQLPHTYYWLAELYSQQKQADKSLQALQTAARIAPEDADVALALGSVYRSRGNDKEAYPFLKRYLLHGKARVQKAEIAAWMKSRKMEVPQYESKAVMLLEEKKYVELNTHLKELLASKGIDTEGNEEISTAYDELLNVWQASEKIDQWYQAKKNSSHAAALRGTTYIQSGYESRGYGYNNTVTGVGAAEFKERLSAAKVMLEYARSLDKTNPETYQGLMVAVQMKDNWLEKAKAFYAEGIALNPDNYSLHHQMFNSLVPRVGGKLEDLFAFSRKAAAESGPRSKATLLVAYAHWEKANEEYEGEPSAYFKKPEVWNECKAALNTAVERFPKSVHVRTLFVRTAMAAGDMDTARVHYAVIQDNLDPRYWAGVKDMNFARRALASVSQ